MSKIRRWSDTGLKVIGLMVVALFLLTAAGESFFSPLIASVERHYAFERECYVYLDLDYCE